MLSRDFGNRRPGFRRNFVSFRAPLAICEGLLPRGAGRFWRWFGWVGSKGQCDQKGTNAYTARTDVEPPVTGKRVVDQTSRQRAGRHAETTGRCSSTDYRPYHPLREIFAREHRIKGHYTGVDKTKQGRHGVKCAQLTREEIGQCAERLQQQARDQNALCSKPVAEKTERDTTAQACQPFHAVDRNCGN